MSAFKSPLPRFQRLRLFAFGALSLQFWASSVFADFDPRGRRAKKPVPQTPAAPRSQAPIKPKPNAASTPASDTQGTDAKRSKEVLTQRYTSAALQQPGDAFPLQRLTELYRERDGNLAALIRDFEAKLTAEPTHLGVLLALAWFNEAEGKADVAAGFLARAVEAHPTNPAPLLALANAHEREGKSQEVARLLQRALPLQRNAAEREQTLRKLRSLALDRKDIDAAREFHRQLVTKANDSSFVRSELGKELLSRGSFSEASAEFERVVRASAGDNRALPPLLLDLGQAQAGAQETDLAIATLKRALALTPKDSGMRRDVLNTLVSVYRDANRLPEVLAFLEQNRAADSAQQVLLADLYVDSGRLEDGLRAYRNALERNPRDVDTRLKLVRLLELRGDLKAAIAEYRSLIQQAPNQPQYVFQLADLLRKVGDRNAALRALDTLVSRAQVDTDTLASAVDYYEQIDEPQKAQALLERVAGITSNPDHLIELGGRYFASGDESRAIATWKRVLDLIPDKARAFHTLGEVYLEHDLTTHALQALNQAVNLAPTVTRYKRSLALALERTGASSTQSVRLQHYAEAQRLWEQLLVSVDAANQKREARQHITTLWSLQGSLKARVAPLERAFRAKPPHLPSGRMLAEVYQRLNQHEDAARVLRELGSLTPGDVSVWSMLEQVLVNQQDLVGAITVAERLVELEPKRAREHYLRLARYAADLYLDDQALRYAQKAVMLSPDDAEGQLRLGDMYRKRGQIELAVQAYRKAVNLNERLYQGYVSLAELLFSQGNVEEADQIWRKLVRSALDEELIRKAARASQQLNFAANTPWALERELLPLALAYPQKPIYRTLLVELYAAWTAPLVQALSQTRSEAVQKRTSAELEAIGKRALKPLLDVLGDPRAHQYLTAIELLAQLRHPDANLPLLTFAQGDAPEPLRERALIAVGLAGPSNVETQLERLLFDGETLKVEESSKVSLAAVWAYCQLQSPRSTTQLIKLLRSDAPTAQVLATITLALRHAPGLMDRLPALLSDSSHPHAQAAAAFAVGELAVLPTNPSTKTALTRVTQLANQGPPLVRATALTTLARVRHAEFEALAAKALLAPDVALRRDASRTLSAYVGTFQPRAGKNRELEQQLDPATMLHALLPAPPTASQAVEALKRLQGQLVTQARSAHGKSEAQAIAISESFTPGDNIGFAPLADSLARATPELQQQAVAIARAIAQGLVTEFTQLTNHPSTQVKTSALRVLLRLEDEQAVEVVSTLLTRADQEHTQIILGLLRQYPRAGLVPSVAGLLSPEHHWSLRREAAITLTAGASSAKPEIDGQTLTARLADRLRTDDNAFVREDLVKAYTAWAGAGARPLLTTVSTKDPEPRVRHAAFQALDTLP